MRIPCPLCGTRDRREFYYYGTQDYLNRPAPDAPIEDWDDHLHLRENPAGETRDLWYHETGCGSWERHPGFRLSFSSCLVRGVFDYEVGAK